MQNVGFLMMRLKYSLRTYLTYSNNCQTDGYFIKIIALCCFCITWAIKTINMFLYLRYNITFELLRDKINDLGFAPSEDSDQPGL